MRMIDRRGGVNRSRKCRLCGGARSMRRIGRPDDPDYAVAVCPRCDTAAEPVGKPAR